jgi:imidazolonepropionase-like amidohydrolase
MIRPAAVWASLGLLLAAGAQWPGSSPRLALVGARIYPTPGSTPIDPGVIVVRGDRIEAIGSRGSVPLPADAKILDCSGKVVVAGFWNSHVHFTEPHWAGADTLPAATLNSHLREMLLQYGFVRVLDTGSLLENTLALRRRIAKGELTGPAILTTGSGFAPAQASPFYILPDRLPELSSAEDARTQVAARLRDGADAIKLFTGSSASPTRIVPMPLDIVRAATAEAHRQGRLVLAHPGNDQGLDAAILGGVDVLAHTTPEGSAWDSGRVELLKRDHVALIPTLQLWAFELKRKGASPAATERFENVALDQLRSYAAAGGEILFGTDVGYMTEYDPGDEYRYMHQAGMSFHQILAALTTAPARRLGKSRNVSGRLETGQAADLVVLEGDPESDIGALSRVSDVLRAGRLVFTRRRGATGPS